MSLSFIPKDLLYCLNKKGTIKQRLQLFLNRRYSAEFKLLELRPEITGLQLNGNVIIPIDENLNSIIDVITQYNLSDIQEDDVVLDIGANNGTCSLIAAKKCKKVYSVEPIFIEQLNKNIQDNNIENITTIECALSDCESIEISYAGKSAKVPGLTLSSILKLCPEKPTFLKMDCEGGEWCIQPHELEGFRAIEAEIHGFNGEHLESFSEMLKRIGFEVTVEYPMKYLMIVHTRRTL